MSPRERLERAALRTRRRRLYRSLLKQGVEPMKARRIACAIHKPGAALQRRSAPIDPASAGIIMPTATRDEMRRQLNAVDRTALRLMSALSLTSEMARKIAEQSFRRVDVSHAKKEEATA